MATSSTSPEATAEITPASLMQRTMWAAAQRWRAAPLNVMVKAVAVQGVLDIGVLERALLALVTRHPTLRAHLEMRGGQLWQVCSAPRPVAVRVHEAPGDTPAQRHAAAVALLHQRAGLPLDISRPASLELWYVRTDAAAGILCFFKHHAMSDGWSSQILFRELAALYEAECSGEPANLPRLREQFADFADRQHQAQAAGGYDRELAYWREELRDLPPVLELPALAPRKGARDWRAESPVAHVDHQLVLALRAVAARQQVTLFSVVLAAVAVLLHHHTQRSDFVVGVSTLNRSAAALRWVGCATNILPARIRLRDAAQPFSSLCADVHATVRRLLEHGKVPLELILRELQTGPLAPPLTTVWCQLRTMMDPLVLPHARGEWRQMIIPRGTLLAELDIDVFEHDGVLDCEFVYRPSLFEAGMVSRLMADFVEILQAAAGDEGATVGDLGRLAEPQPTA